MTAVRTRLSKPRDPRSAARAAAYDLFSRLYLRGITAELLPVVHDLPELGVALPEPFDPDAAAAEHHRLYGLQVPPWAGVFLDPEGRIGGDAAGVVRALYGRAGLELADQSEEADHLGHTLALLGQLEARPALAREVIDQALLPWLPWLVEVVERHGHAFHRALAGLTLELVLDHRAALGGGGGPHPPSPPVVDPLDDAKSGLREIALFLVTPARGGLYLARDDVRRLATEQRLPTGFGGRADSLETLLRTAGEYGGLAEVVERLRGLVQGGRAACSALERCGVEGTSGPVALRRERLDTAAAVLSRMGAAVEGA